MKYICCSSKRFGRQQNCSDFVECNFHSPPPLFFLTAGDVDTGYQSEMMFSHLCGLKLCSGDCSYVSVLQTYCEAVSYWDHGIPWQHNVFGTVVFVVSTISNVQIWVQRCTYPYIMQAHTHFTLKLKTVSIWTKSCIITCVVWCT